MNEVGLNAKWLGGDMTDVKTQKFTVEVLNHMRENWQIIRRCTEICIT